MEKLGVNITVREEDMDGKKVFIVFNEETGVADFGDSLEKAIMNFRKSLELYLDTYPEKKCVLMEEEKHSPPMVSRILV